MTLLGAILKKVRSAESVSRKYASPPPEVEEVVTSKRKQYVDKYAHVRAKVDTSGPHYAPGMHRAMLASVITFNALRAENVRLLIAIRKAHFQGRVDNRWDALPPASRQYYEKRANFLKHTQLVNRQIYKRLATTGPRVVTTANLRRDWTFNRNEMLRRAHGKFVLFPTVPTEHVEDVAFVPPAGVKRPRVHLTIRTRGCAVLGDLVVELFTDVCPNTCRLFLELLDGDESGYGYVGTRFFRKSGKMLVSDSGLTGNNEILLKVVSPEGVAFTAYFAEDTLVEEVKNRSLDYFYPNGETGASRYKIVRVCDTATLHDFLTLAQEQVSMQDELLLIERRTPEAGTLWDLGAVRAPQAAAIAAATASLPAPQNTVRQPNLQTLLSTNELSFELRKILISLIEAGARLAASGRNYEMTLAQLSAALDEPQRTQQIVVQVITPEEIAARFNQPELHTIIETSSSDGNELYKRAEHLQRFLEKFRAWRAKIAEPPNPEALAALSDLGFSIEDSDKALRNTGCNVPAAASWLIGERGSSVFELINGLPDGLILQTLLKQPQIQRGLLNTRMLIAFIAMVGQSGSASLWLNSPHGSPLLSQISRTYHSEKKVPGLFWSGGDVIYDNGFGCYAQRGRVRPIGAQNFHFPHSMPGLLSMRVTKDDEMCGIFNITFKPLPQFDLRNEVFGRVVRPCATYESIQSIGAPLSDHPAVELAAARRRALGRWHRGVPNTRIITNCHLRDKK